MDDKWVCAPASHKELEEKRWKEEQISDAHPTSDGVYFEGHTFRIGFIPDQCCDHRFYRTCEPEARKLYWDEAEAMMKSNRGSYCLQNLRVYRSGAANHQGAEFYGSYPSRLFICFRTKGMPDWEKQPRQHLHWNGPAQL